MTTQPAPTSGTNAAGAGVILSTGIKAVLVALVSIHVLPWDGQQTAAVALALSSLIDIGMYFGWIRPSLSAQLAVAAASVPPGAISVQPVAVPVPVPTPDPPLEDPLMQRPTSPAAYDPRHDEQPTGPLPQQPYPHQDMT